MIIRCAWCKSVTGNKPPFGGRYDNEVTDGICDDCLEKYFGGEVKNGKEKSPEEAQDGGTGE
uniref:Uncharacterized protein n=1 Tax=viral metagenome TaxID=1070528 RepID=A0A6H1Z7S6_9ZZZZ